MSKVPLGPLSGRKKNWVLLLYILYKSSHRLENVKILWFLVVSFFTGLPPQEPTFYIPSFSIL